MVTSLDLFSPPVARWFRGSFGAPTPPQEQGWPLIAQGRNVLILAPTGSGKTLAAFLYAINDLVATPASERASWHGVHTLYVSPLRALAADIERNLETPLAGIRGCASEMGMALPELKVGVRTGDTSPAERQRMLRRPPDLLITTPESLHLLLTARRSREMLRDVRYVIVDEIHALCGEKRGTFVALLLERLEHLCGRSLVRIGLSATQRPLDRVARFLGGYDDAGEPRDVVVVDCGMRKGLDLKVISPVPDLRLLPRPDGSAPSVWPSIYGKLLSLVETHRSTLIFANNRRAVERIAAEMNRLAGRSLVRAHHGSVSKEYRREIESDLKAGRLPALAATASLELGIDMGAVDLVCQVETPTSVSSGLQRVGRAGHVFRATSVGRLLPKTRSDLLRMAGMALAMRRGEISAVHVPESPLDVLAQQLVAMAAAEEWSAEALYRVVRRADPYHGLSREAFDGVLRMMSGAYHTPAFPGLRARVLWERSADRVSALPGAMLSALAAGGTIPDTGQYAMVLDDGTRLGELDEEFVFERRVGDHFVLGTGRWRIVEIRHDRVIVAPSAVEEAQLPFWKGEGLGHDAEFGERLGAFVAECVRRRKDGSLVGWLQSECALDEDAARNLRDLVSEQSADGGLPDDSTILVEAFPSDTGDLRVAILSTFGRAFHVGLWLALRAELRRAEPEVLVLPEGIVSNDGILLRPGSRQLGCIVRSLEALADGDVRGRLTEEVHDSPFFALKFRRNAGRALLLPRSHPGKRVPLWLQRLRSHDLLSYASSHPEFPIVAETYREILEDALPVASLEHFARRVADGTARFAVHRSARPSPLAASLVQDFVGKYLYEPDQPARTSLGARPSSSDLAAAVRRDGIRDEAVRAMEDRLQALSPDYQARDGVEVVDLLARLGDLTTEELRARCLPEAESELGALARDGRIVEVVSPLVGEPRWVAADDAAAYAAGPSAVEGILLRYVRFHAGRTLGEIGVRYPGAGDSVEVLAGHGQLARVDLPGRPGALVDRDVLVGLRRMSTAARRREIAPVPLASFARAVLRRQGVGQPRGESNGAHAVVAQLAGWSAPVSLWPDLLDARMASGRAKLEALVRGGGVEWRGSRVGGTRWLTFAPAGAGRGLLPERVGTPEGPASRVVAQLEGRGALFLHELAAALALPPSAVDEVLWELTWSGWVTNDSLVAAQRPGPGRGRPTRGLGRWSAPRQPEAGDREEMVAVVLRAVLARDGLVCREMVEREALALRWSEAYPVLCRMEWRGDVDRGYFVAGLSGPQFVAPGFSEALKDETSDAEARLLHVMDPALVVGGGAPRRGPGSYVVVRDGVALLAVEAHGARLAPLRALSPEERRCAVATLPRLVARAGQRPRVRVEAWDGVPAAESEAAADLAAAGFVRDDQGMVLYRQYGAAT